MCDKKQFETKESAEAAKKENERVLKCTLCSKYHTAPLRERFKVSQSTRFKKQSNGSDNQHDT